MFSKKPTEGKIKHKEDNFDSFNYQCLDDLICPDKKDAIAVDNIEDLVDNVLAKSKVTSYERHVKDIKRIRPFDKKRSAKRSKGYGGAGPIFGMSDSVSVKKLFSIVLSFVLLFAVLASASSFVDPDLDGATVNPEDMLVEDTLSSNATIPNTNHTDDTVDDDTLMGENESLNETTPPIDIDDENMTGNETIISTGLNLSLQSDKDVYLVNETVSIDGTVSYNNSLVNTSVSLLIDNLNYNLSVALNAFDGRFYYQFVPIVVGSYVVQANVSYLNETVQEEIGFDVLSVPLENVSQNVSELSVWDDTDYQERYVGDQVTFYANYSSFNQSIKNATCLISFNVGTWTEPATMSFSGGLYVYSRSFDTGGTYDCRVWCSAVGFENRSAVDEFVISEVVSNVSEVSIVNPEEHEHVNVLPGTSFYVERTVDGPSGADVVFAPLYSDGLTIEKFEILRDNEVTSLKDSSPQVFSAGRGVSNLERRIDGLRERLPVEVKSLNRVSYSQSFTIQGPCTVRIWFKAPSWEEITSGLKPSSGKISYLTFSNNGIDGFDYESSTWWDSGWGYRTLITINSSQVPANLNNFPILVNITDTDLRDDAQNDGDDIAFVLYSDNSTQLNHETELFNGTTGELFAWVNITSLSSTVDTKIWMYYNNSGASSQENINDVWDSNYVMVQHLNETSGTYYDSTKYGSNATPVNDPIQDATGVIDGANSYDDDTDYFTLDDAYLRPTDQVTVEVWAIATSGPAQYDNLVGVTEPEDKWADGYLIFFNSVNTVHFYVGDYQANVATAGIAASNWNYIVGTYDKDAGGNDEVKIYVDGNLGGFDDYGTAIDYEADTRGRINEAGGNRGIVGSVDEIRISDISRNASWINTCYNNQKNQSTFISFESEEEISIGIITNASTGVEETNATLNGWLQDNASADTTCYFLFNDTNDFGSPIFNLSKGVIAEGAEFENDTAGETTLTPGKLYYFKTQANNSAVWSDGSVEIFLTKPENISAFTATLNGATQIDLTWTDETGGDGAYIEYAKNSPPSPWNEGDGTPIDADGNVTSPFSHLSLDAGTHYYYKAWSYATDGGWTSSGNQTAPRGDAMTADETTPGPPSVATNATTGIEETNATLKGWLQSNGTTDTTCYLLLNDTNDFGSPIFNLSKGVIANGAGFENDTAGETTLTKGKLYYVDTKANNSAGWNESGGVQTFLTKPDPPTGLNAQTNSSSMIYLTWSTGSGFNNTYIERNASGDTVWARGSGTMIYNSSGTNYEDTGLTVGFTYYYQAWTYANWSYDSTTLHQWSDANASASNVTVGPPIIVTNESTGIEETNATLNGWLQNNGTLDTTCYLLLNDTNDFGSPIFNLSKGVIANGEGFSNDTAGETTLTKGTLYYFDTKANNSAGWNESGGVQTFLTKPDPPTGLNAQTNSSSMIYLTWSTGTGFNTTYIERNASGDTVWARGEGTEIYNGSGTNYEDTGLTDGTTYYYQAWSSANWTYDSTTLHQWSDANASVSNTTSSLPVLSNPTPANGSAVLDSSFTWNIIITEPNGDTFNWTIECSNGQTNSSNDDTNGTKNLSLSGLSWNTEYTVWVNVTNSYAWTREWFTFIPSNEKINNISVYVAHPAPIDKDKEGFPACIVFNPTGSPITVSDVWINATSGTPFDSVTAAECYPTTGWSEIVADTCFQWSGTEVIGAGNVTAFYAHLKTDKDDGTFSFDVNYTAMIDGVNYYPRKNYTTDLMNADYEYAQLSFGYTTWGADMRSTLGPIFTIERNISKAESYNITLGELGGKLGIDSGATLTIKLPSVFSNIEDTGGAGWDTAYINGNTIIVNTTVEIDGDGAGYQHLNYSFNATAPSSAGLYVINCTMSESDCYPVFEGAVKVIRNNPTQSGESPTNDSTLINTTPGLYVVCSDNDAGDTLSATWWSNSTGSWAQFGSNETSFASGTNITQTNINFTEEDTTYWWSVNLTDGTGWNNETYHFTTSNTSIDIIPSQWDIGTTTIGNYNYSTSDFYFNLTNEGNAPLHIQINASNATNATTGASWNLTSTPGFDNYSLQYNKSGGFSWTNINQTYDTFVTNLAVSGWQTFDLNIFMATTATNGDPLSLTVTFRSVVS